MDEEGIRRTDNELIHIGCPIEFDEEKFLQDLEDSYDDITSEEVDIKEFVRKMVPTYIGL